MGKLIITIAVILCSIIASEAAFAKDPQSVSDWFETLGSKTERTTRLRFYFHDTVSGTNATAVYVARAETTASSPTSFGLTAVTDDPLTAGPDIGSAELGRGQGIYSSSQIAGGGMALYFSLNFVFTTGKYNGSTLSTMGQIPLYEPYRELSVVGGTGVFRLARGIATASTVMFNQTTGDAIIEYNLVVLHFR